MYCWDRHDRLSSIASLTLSARRRRVGLYFLIHDANIKAQKVEAFFRDVQRRLNRPVILVLDRWAVHRKAAKALLGDKRFRIEWLPPYAPDLNPVEHVWKRMKYDDMANYVPDDVLDLEIEAEICLEEFHDNPDMLRSCFHGAKLQL